ncbi:outer membrane protein [Methylocapsa acidiphila]|uniref:outer membrane protein n=1 Tax=Methylocapsa acidiphila TaxID=133552 RepID=UPI000422E0FE|nr:outer membrane beta-barrel protein [Methylocapsa acidiphila]
MIRKFLLSTAAITALSTTALAADLPSRAPPPVYIPPPAFTWTGVYIGGTVGYAEGFHNYTDVGYYDYGSTRQDQSQGFIGGGQIGINFQTGSFVYGLETDFSGLTNKSTNNAYYSYYDQYYDTHKINWLGTTRGRIGLAVDRTLLYFTAGVAYGNFSDSRGANYFGEGYSYHDWNSSTTKIGWVAGLGLEYAVTPNWTIKGEALYANLGSTTTNLQSSYNYSSQYNARFQDSVAIIRAGFNYKFDLFGAPAPVVAKY